MYMDIKTNQIYTVFICWLYLNKVTEEKALSTNGFTCELFQTFKEEIILMVY